MSKVVKLNFWFKICKIFFSLLFSFPSSKYEEIYIFKKKTLLNSGLIVRGLDILYTENLEFESIHHQYIKKMYNFIMLGKHMML